MFALKDRVICMHYIYAFGRRCYPKWLTLHYNTQTLCPSLHLYFERNSLNEKEKAQNKLKHEFY